MVPLKASLRDVLGTVLLSSISHDLIKNADSPIIFFPFPVREKIQTISENAQKTKIPFAAFKCLVRQTSSHTSTD